jgi:hypothetical protein
MRDSIANSTSGPTQEEILRSIWHEASLPLQDPRPEVLVWYEERQLQARNSLIELRKRSGKADKKQVRVSRLLQSMRSILRMFRGVPKLSQRIEGDEISNVRVSPVGKCDREELAARGTQQTPRLRF